MLLAIQFPLMATVAFLGVSFATGSVGAVAGAIGSHFFDFGIDDRFVKRLSAQLHPGTSALFALVNKSTPGTIVNDLRSYGGTVLHTTLSAEAEDRLHAALREGHDAALRQQSMPQDATPMVV